MKQIDVVGAAITDGGKVLAAQRSPEMREPLKWEFPGGKVELGETHEEALQREILEELSVKIKIKGFIASGYSEVAGRRIVLYVYEAEILEGEPFAREHSRLEWIGISRIRELDWAEADIPACEELLKQKAINFS